MTTRTKLNISSAIASIMMMLNVFSKPLHIPEAFQWVLIIGVFVPLGLMFYFIKQQKLEKQARPVPVEVATGLKQRTKQRLILLMVIGSVIGLCSPLWMPLTGTTLGWRGDLICGLITTIIVCAIIGYRLRKLARGD